MDIRQTLNVSPDLVTTQLPPRIHMSPADFHQLLVERHSIRRYTPEPLSAEDVQLILEAALLAPTSKNSRAWQFVAVDDRERLDSLAACKPAGAIPVANAAMAIVVGADTTVTEPWIEDCSVAAAFMQLQAQALGLGSCWIQIRGRFTADGLDSEEYVREVLGIPEEIGIACIITLGHRDEQRKPADTSKLFWDHVHIDHWNGR